MSLAGLAQETLKICHVGVYQTRGGATVHIRRLVRAAIDGTQLYTPDALDELVLPPARAEAPPPRVTVTDESTAAAARRLAGRRALALNFASAKNPGGGFLGGAKAQEEDLARCSALYPCQIEHRAYYDANRACGTMLYTDHMIYSPEVPFFRDERLELLNEPFTVSVVTAPAPNAGESERHGRHEGRYVTATLRARALKVLLLAASHGHRVLILGAWGCGVFRNDPRDVAEAFADGLADPRLRGAFADVVFAIWDRGREGDNLRAFRARFGG